MAQRESSITVSVRVRPFTSAESSHLVTYQQDNIFLGDGSLSLKSIAGKENSYAHKRYGPKGLRKIVDVVDDRMLIFDPPHGNPLATLPKNTFQRTSVRYKEHRFVFDKLFDEDSSQQTVYEETARPLLDSVLDGFNATVFAYGATGCGKTHTISGTMDQPGIIFLTMKELFERIEELKDTKHIDVSLSYLEIYNETIRDLMEPNTGKLLTLREDANNRITVSNLSSHTPSSVQDVMDMIIIGNGNRTCSPTEANATSSRSHAVLQINVIQRNRTADIQEDHTFATLSIIDLAGSERAAATKNRGERLHEGANINKSLLALGNCINALCDPRRRNHVPYRDSKLTRLLKFSLGGNCKTVMIVCVSPSSHHYDETLNTLKYADRAKQIKTKVIRNQHSLNRHVGSYLKMITEQKQEIEELRNRESLKIDEAVERYKVKAQRVTIGILELLDTIKNNLNSKKFQNLKIKKSLILCKRRLLLEQRMELKQYITFSQEVAVSPELKQIIELIVELLAKIDAKITELEYLYEQESELDYVLASSTDAAMRKMSELEGWTQYDKLTLETSVALIKDSVEKTILYNASILQDRIVNGEQFMSNFKFTTSTLFQAMMHIHNQSYSTDLELSKSTLQETVRNFYKSFRDCIDQILKIDEKFENFSSDLHNDLSADTVIPTSPIRRLNKARASSPFRLSPSSRLSLVKPSGVSRITKTSSPLPTKQKVVKKVRWDVPNASASIIDKDNDNVEDSDETMDDIANPTEDYLTTANKDSSVDESINQSLSELEQVFSQRNKRKSLTSKTLKPSSANSRRSLTGTPFTPSISTTAGTSRLGAPVRVNDDFHMDDNDH
ncbi:KIP3 [Cyberlindnera jadinii]|uniref:Kinesin-like protein n=1 Tax=Cyberlindnera jadinii (strain ATCC 18201 / CBS 1600 / BCRC 20928 / JCM 3617 / NBRC 0987 / NRRL Y-1542) TaxID=983966 RepID=A0A0H5CFL3_CYBJN|nr:KIP3 [Cyberlindnera jadinii]